MPRSRLLPPFDFIATTAAGLDNPNQWFVVGVTDSEISALGASYTPQYVTAIPEPQAWALLLGGLGVLGGSAKRRQRG